MANNYLSERTRESKLQLEEALHGVYDASIASADFLTKAGHDIRTPLNAIIGMTELAKAHINDPNRVVEYLDKVLTSSAHLLGLVYELLDTRTMEGGILEISNESINLETFLNDIKSMITIDLEHKNQTLTIDINPDINLDVFADKQKLIRILITILDNCQKYTPANGHISVSLTECEYIEPRIGAYQFTIQDDGMGIPSEYIEHIFEPFSRSDDAIEKKIDGVGMGLTIVDGIVKMLGGTICVESEYKKGTKFIVTLFLEKKDAPVFSLQQNSSNTVSDFSSMHVLLVEDNEINQEIAIEMLSLLGVKADVCDNGKIAVDTIMDKPPKYYDIVLMDIQMPVLNGYDATRAIRHSGKEGTDILPIVSITADALPSDFRKSKLAGMNGHLTKPISLTKLSKVLSQYCIQPN